jgi:xylulokinase
MDYLAGIDLGSTTLKAVIYDTAGNVVASACRPTERFHPDPEHPEWTVWQPDQIWGGSAAAMKEAVSQISDPHLVKGVAVTGMGMDGVPVDEAGRWLYPFISWHCPRTQPQFDWWVEHIGAEKTFSLGGNTLWRFSTALRLLWMAEHEPQILKNTYKWLLIEDFVNTMLCGKMATDYTMASCTLMFDQRKLDWSDEILGLAGIDKRLLTPAYPSGTRLGGVTEKAAAETGLAVGTPVVLGGHDYLCGALPVGAIRPGVILDVSGTWEIVLAAAKEPVLTPEAQKTGATVEAHVARNLYAIWGGAVSSDMLEWYRKEYGFEAKYKADQAAACGQSGVDWDFLMQDAASSPVGARGVMFLPHLSGAGCPDADPHSLGAWVGLSNFVTKGDILRALIEGLDYQFLDIVRTMQGLGVPFDQLVVVGGVARNKFWMQNKADMVGLPLEVPEVEDATPLGAAMLAGIGVGVYQDEQDAYQHVCKPGTIYEPDPAATRQYEDLFKIYKQLYPALRPISQQLYSRFVG